MQYFRIAVVCLLLLLSSYPVSAQWTFAQSEQLTAGPENDHTSGGGIAVDNLGNINVVFDQIDSIGHNLFFMRKVYGSNWSVPTPVGDHNQVQGGASIAIDKNTGEFYVVFYENANYKLGVFDGQNWIYHNLVLPPDYEDSGCTDIALDLHGNLHFAMIADDPVTNIIHTGYAYWDGSDTLHFQVFDQTILIEGGSFANPTICARSNGSVAIAYRNYYHAMQMRVETAENFSLGGTNWIFQPSEAEWALCYTGEIAADSQDNLHLIFQTNLEIPFPGQIYHISKSAGADQWGFPVVISGDYNTRHPQIVLDEFDNIHILSQQTQGLYCTGNILYIANMTGVWTQESLITGNSFDPFIDIDHEGNCSMIYRQGLQFYGDNNIHFYGYTAGPAAPPMLTVDIVPSTTPVIIPAGGGAFDFTLNITNIGADSAIFDGWIEAVLPDSSVYGPIILRQNLIFAPGDSIWRIITQNVPGNAPGGIYAFRLKLGEYPSIVYASDEFSFLKQGAVNGTGAGWEITGWDAPQDSPINLKPMTFNLFSVFPNPFNNSTTITFDLPEAGEISLKVFDISGREVQDLGFGIWESGTHSVVWDAKDNASGVYFVRLEAAECVKTQKIVLMK